MTETAAPAQPQTVILGGRPYTFTSEGAETRDAVSTLGSLFNSRGAFAGFVMADHTRGDRRTVLGLKVRGGIAAERAALATLTVEPS